MMNTKPIQISAHSAPPETDAPKDHRMPGCAAPTHWRTGLWLAGGIALTANMWLCVWVRVNHLVPATVLLLAGMGMGMLYVVLLLLRPGRISRGVWLAMIVMAVLMRIPWFLVPASSGKDYCRYLWDGAVTAKGINPYVYSPQRVREGQVGNPTLERLAQSDRSTLKDINHPELRTIYPPVAQGAFALAYWIAPFDLTGWRIVLLAFDALAAIAVLWLLRAAAMPLSLAFIYLWNPLLVMETYGGCHVDLLAAAMVAVFTWALATNRSIVATVAIAMAIGVKLWPVLLLPFLLRSLWGKWRQLALAAAILASLLTVMAIPFVEAFGTETNSGLLTYARIWAGRSGAYQVFGRMGWYLRSYFSLDIDGHYVGRALMMLVLLPAVLWLGLRSPGNVKTLCRRMALIILLMLLLGPVLWPWYYVVVIPLAAVASPRLGLLLWTALLPLCYLEAAGLSATHLTWLVHVPVWLLLAAEWAWPRVRRWFSKETAHA
jgi:alpha-1,6-mannosyltransferase